MSCNCNCKNGSDVLDFLTPAPGGTEASAVYVIGLTHYTCGGRKMLVDDTTHPVISQLTATPVGKEFQATLNLSSQLYTVELGGAWRN